MKKNNKIEGNNKSNLINKSNLDGVKVYKKVKKESKKKLIIASLILIVGFLVGTYFYINRSKPSLVLKEYFDDLESKNYEAMYDLVQTSMSQDEFVTRIKNIYEGIEAQNISITVTAKTTNIDNSQYTNITYTNSMDTVAGKLTFSNTAKMAYSDGKYKIDWTSNLIFPDLDDNEKVRVTSIEPTRGNIYDKNDVAIAKLGTCYLVGLVKGKMDNTTDISKIANLLGISEETINNLLNASYVKDDTFVPLRKLSKDDQEIKANLLKVKGIMITDSKIRIYPYKESTSILIGYVQDGDGKSGLEYAFNDKLKGISGKEIYIEKDGAKIKTLVKIDVKNGEDVKLTIDVEKQQKIYNEFKDDKGAYVALNYNTGEILALVSTPSYDANDFSLGITDTEWNSLQNDESKPMYNRYLSSYAPGSSLKSVIGAIGLSTNSFNADDDFGTSGTKWQKDSSWKNLYITTLEEYKGSANLENALIYSDNIYFAKAALKIGKTNLKNGLDNFGFNNKINFVQDISKSTYGNMDSEASIANTGYGQDEVLVNPIHMATIYSVFANGGNMIKPYIEKDLNEKNNNEKYIKQNVISNEISSIIKNDLREVVTKGTATDCNIEEKNIYGKTGTAEIKNSQDDENGTEIGWFDAFDDNGFLIISMVQDVKNIGGSHYVVKKVRNLF